MNQKSLYSPNPKEDQRLKLQNQLLEDFDGIIYEEVLAGHSAKILDVGCGIGVLYSRLNADVPVRYLGIDISAEQIAKARDLHPEAAFETMDIENADFEERLRSSMAQNGLDGFSLIHISMVLLHLQDPQKVLTVLHSCLEEGGIIMIRDIDDGLNYANPDPDGWFGRLFQIGRKDERTGNRFMGRDVCPCLACAGYSDIRVRKQGLTTAGLSPERKEAYYHMTFQFIMDDTAFMLERHPDDSSIREDYDWVAANRDEIHRRFMETEFVASIGFMTYTATK